MCKVGSIVEMSLFKAIHVHKLRERTVVRNVSSGYARFITLFVELEENPKSFAVLTHRTRVDAC